MIIFTSTIRNSPTFGKAQEITEEAALHQLEHYFAGKSALALENLKEGKINDITVAGGTLTVGSPSLLERAKSALGMGQK